MPFKIKRIQVSPDIVKDWDPVDFENKSKIQFHGTLDDFVIPLWDIKPESMDESVEVVKQKWIEGYGDTGETHHITIAQVTGTTAAAVIITREPVYGIVTVGTKSPRELMNQEISIDLQQKVNASQIWNWRPEQQTGNIHIKLLEPDDELLKCSVQFFKQSEPPLEILRTLLLMCDAQFPGRKAYTAIVELDEDPTVFGACVSIYPFGEVEAPPVSGDSNV